MNLFNQIGIENEMHELGLKIVVLKNFYTEDELSASNTEEL